MPPKLGELGKVKLNARLLEAGKGGWTDEDELKAVDKNWLVDLAYREGVITRLERDRSYDYDFITLKRYLRSLVTEQRLLDAIDTYVQLASCVRAAGSKLANLFAITAFEEGRFGKGLLEDTLLSQTFVKYCLLPFKSELSGSKAAPNADLQRVWEAHRGVLLPTFPPPEELKALPWDQVLSDMSLEYIGALKAHVMTHLGDRARLRLQRRLLDGLGVKVSNDPESRRKLGTLPNRETFFLSDAYVALECAKGVDALPDQVAEEVKGARASLGVTGSARVSKMNKLTDAIFKLHIEMSREAEAAGARSWSACPVLKTSRSFAFIDERILEALLRRVGLHKTMRVCSDGSNGQVENLSLLETALGLHADAWNAASRLARKKRRARRSGRASKRRGGVGKFPKGGWRVTSATTDGIAICAVLQRPKRSRAPGTSPPKEDDARSHEKRLQDFLAALPAEARTSLKLGTEDPGRANISQFVFTDPGSGETVTLRLQRGRWLRATLQDRRAAAEQKRRRERRLLRIAIDSLGEAGTWRTTRLDAFGRMLQAQRMVNDILVDEYVVDPWYAHWKMLLWRRKRSVLMQFYSSVVKAMAAPGAPVVIGTGDAGFAASGKGEKAVPTQGARYELRRALKAMKQRNRQSLHVYLDERRTTMCCARCGAVLEGIRGDDGFELRGLKVCTRCPETVAGRGACQWWHRLVKVDEGSKGGCGCGGALRDIKDDKGDVLRRLKLCCSPTRDDAHSCRLLNRDVNAGNNLLEVLRALVAGEPRPLHLRPAPRRRRANPVTAGPLNAVQGPGSVSR